MKLYLFIVSFLVLALYSNGQDKKIPYAKKNKSVKNEAKVFLLKIRNLGTNKILPKQEIELEKLMENDKILIAFCFQIDPKDKSFLKNPNLLYVLKCTYFKFKTLFLKKAWRNRKQASIFTSLVEHLLKLEDKAINDDIFKFFKTVPLPEFAIEKRRMFDEFESNYGFKGEFASTLIDARNAQIEKMYIEYFKKCNDDVVRTIMVRSISRTSDSTFPIEKYNLLKELNYNDMSKDIVKELDAAYRGQVGMASALLTKFEPPKSKEKRLRLLKFLLKDEIRALLPSELIEQKN